jgi:hypothetical protein
LPAATACEYVRQVALGLQHGHERGLVHRDIKPANLILTSAADSPRGLVKILDMGLARLQYDTGDERGKVKTRLGAMMGTPDYISPEQIMDTHKVDIRSDIYSLGCTLYHLLTGEKPYPGKTVDDKINGHLRGLARPAEELCPDLPPGLGELIRKMMAKKAADRFQTPAGVATALAPYCGGALPAAMVAPAVPAPAVALPAAVAASRPAVLPTAISASPASRSVAAAAEYGLSSVPAFANKKRTRKTLLAGVFTVAVLLVLGWWFWPRGPRPEIPPVLLTPRADPEPMPAPVVPIVEDPLWKYAGNVLKPDDTVDAVSTPPPSGAQVLFDGKTLARWVMMDGKTPGIWKLVAGRAMEARAADMMTRETFDGKFRLHVEFRVPYLPTQKGQGRGNSGVFLQGRYEVQILDSYGLDSKEDDCGAIYGFARPLVNACKAPTFWQNYDIIYQSPKRQGAASEPAIITVLQNGIKIHDRLRISRLKGNQEEIVAGTSGAVGGDPTTPGPIVLQYHNNPVQFRNIWLAKE